MYFESPRAQVPAYLGHTDLGKGSSMSYAWRTRSAPEFWKRTHLRCADRSSGWLGLLHTCSVSWAMGYGRTVLGQGITNGLQCFVRKGARALAVLSLLVWLLVPDLRWHTWWNIVWALGKSLWNSLLLRQYIPPLVIKQIVSTLFDFLFLRPKECVTSPYHRSQLRLKQQSECV